jgi:hypothetical protein
LPWTLGDAMALLVGVVTGGGVGLSDFCDSIEQSRSVLQRRKPRTVPSVSRQSSFPGDKKMQWG